MSDSPDYLMTPKFIKDRLIRIETRLVKYQEHNVMQIDEAVSAIDQLALVLQEVLYKLDDMSTEESVDGTDQPIEFESDEGFNDASEDSD